MNQNNANCRDFSKLALKKDSEFKPIWIGGARSDGEDNIILLEVNNPHYANCTEFMIAIAEPKGRPDHIHEYKLTKYSLYAAASIGFSQEQIEQRLNMYCKNEKIPEPVSEFIKEHCSSYGKVKLVLKSNKFCIETNDKASWEKIN